MNHQVEIRRYRRLFKQPFQTAHGLRREREGFLIRITDQEGQSGYGEVAPIPWIGSETLEEAEEFLNALSGKGLRSGLGAISELPACVFVVDSAMAAFREDSVELPRRKVAVAGLLPAGEAALESLPGQIEGGFTTFKWKIGVGRLKVEQEIFRKLKAAAPNKIRFRLDANGGLSLEETIDWLEFLDENEAEFLEQPMAPSEFNEMNRLLERFRTPIALDESVGNARQFEAAHNRGWRGLYVVKPAVFGALREGVALLPALRPRLIFSSAFETSIGFEANLRWASRWQPEDRAAGFGTGGFIEEDGFFRHPHLPALIPGLVDLKKIWENPDG